MKHVQKIAPGSLKSTRAGSVARLYPQGVSLVTAGRPDLASVAIQNLEALSQVSFWYGLIPLDPLDPVATLPEDPASWSSGQLAIAVSVISTYGEVVKAGQYLEPFLAPNAQVYSYVSSGTVRAHVKEG